MTWGRVVAALAVLAAGCTHRQELAADGSPLEVGHAVTARPRAGGEVDGVIVKGPLGGYRVRLERPRRELELGELTSLRRESVGRGALDGLLIGLATGVVLGGVLGAATWDEDSYSVVHSRLEATLLGAAMLGGVGGLVGTAGGAAGQATYEYALPAQR